MFGVRARCAAIAAPRKSFGRTLGSCAVLLAAGLLFLGLATPANAQPVPVVKIIDAPDVVSIGEDFTITLTFQNTGTVGFGPYLDLFLPALGVDDEFAE